MKWGPKVPESISAYIRIKGLCLVCFSHSGWVHVCARACMHMMQESDCKCTYDASMHADVYIKCTYIGMCLCASVAKSMQDMVRNVNCNWSMYQGLTSCADVVSSKSSELTNHEHETCARQNLDYFLSIFHLRFSLLHDNRTLGNWTTITTWVFSHS